MLRSAGSMPAAAPRNMIIRLLRFLAWRISLNARLAQRESACFTRRMSAVRSGQRAPTRVRSSFEESTAVTWRRRQGQSLPDAPSISSRSSVAEQSLDKRSTDVRFITGGPDSIGGRHERELACRCAPSFRREPGRAYQGKGEERCHHGAPRETGAAGRRNHQDDGSGALNLNGDGADF
jgi:hypothetical protein